MTDRSLQCGKIPTKIRFYQKESNTPLGWAHTRYSLKSSLSSQTIHPVVDAIVKNLCEIDLIQYVRVSPEDIQAFNEIKIKGRIKIPVSTTGHPSAVGVHLILDFTTDTIQFFEITSVKGSSPLLTFLTDNGSQLAICHDHFE